MDSRRLLIITTVCVALFATNPSTDDYVAWVKDTLSHSAPAGEQQLNKALLAIFGGPFVSASTQRINYLLFSIFVTQLDAQNRLTTLGLLRNFIPLSQAASFGPAAPGAHVISSGTEGRWIPDDGYIWVVNPPPPGDFRVRWEAGRLSSQHAHVVAAEAEGRWLPEDGYVWVVNPPPPGDFRVGWEAGRLSSQHSHVVAAEAEGRWLPEDGYVWVVNPPGPGDFSIRWAAGRLSSQHAHVVAAEAEGRWRPQVGYSWVVNPPVPGDFRVRSIEP